VRLIVADDGGKRNTPGAVPRAAPGDFKCEDAKACAQLGRRLRGFGKTRRSAISKHTVASPPKWSRHRCRDIATPMSTRTASPPPWCALGRAKARQGAPLDAPKLAKVRPWARQSSPRCAPGRAKARQGAASVAASVAAS